MTTLSYTVNVTIRVYDQQYNPIENASVSAVLSSVMKKYGIILPSEVVGYTDENGEVTISLLPSEEDNSVNYIFTISAEDKKDFRMTASIPNEDCFLSDCIMEDL